MKLKSLEMVLVANTGYSSGMVIFSCRIAYPALRRDPPVDLIAYLKDIVRLGSTGLAKRLGDTIGQGHREASGGGISVADFKLLMTLMEVDIKHFRKIVR